MSSEVDQQTAIDVERQLEDARAALEEALVERNQLWEELHRRADVESELEHYKSAVAAMERSLSWRLTAPLRIGKRLAFEAKSIAGLAGRHLRARRSRR